MYGAVRIWFVPQHLSDRPSQKSHWSLPVLCQCPEVFQTVSSHALAQSHAMCGVREAVAGSGYKAPAMIDCLTRKRYLHGCV